jgi:hypothetical protein
MSIINLGFSCAKKIPAWPKMAIIQAQLLLIGSKEYTSQGCTVRRCQLKQLRRKWWFS